MDFYIIYESLYSLNNISIEEIFDSEKDSITYKNNHEDKNFLSIYKINIEIPKNIHIFNLYEKGISNEIIITNSYFINFFEIVLLKNQKYRHVSFYKGTSYLLEDFVISLLKECIKEFTHRIKIY